MVCAFDRVVPQIASVRKRWDGRTELKETLHPSPMGAWQGRAAQDQVPAPSPPVSPTMLHSLPSPSFLQPLLP